jgi:hypothetical protein
MICKLSFIGEIVNFTLLPGLFYCLVDKFVKDIHSKNPVFAKKPHSLSKIQELLSHFVKNYILDLHTYYIYL